MSAKAGRILFAVILILFIVIVLIDQLSISGYQKRFGRMEEVRIETSNRLATAKIVHENLNHVRDLIFQNMDFPNQPDTLGHETHFFNFITTCINDLKLKLISVKPLRPVQAGLITTYGYEIEIQGDFFKFGELCSKFENSRRVVSVESYTVGLFEQEENSIGAPQNKMIHVKMKINTYRVRKNGNPE